MAIHASVVAETRGRFARIYGLTIDTLRLASQSLIESQHIVVKASLAHAIREWGNSAKAIADRYFDIRGTEDELLGAIDNSHGSPGSTLAQGIDLLSSALNSDHSMDYPILLTSDHDSIDLLNTLRLRNGRATVHVQSLGAVPSKAPKFWDALPDRPGRPVGLRIVQSASFPSFFSESANFLHSVMFSIELCAAEVCAANILLHGHEMPPSLLVSMTKQIQDEMRHYFVLEELLRDHGSKVGDFEIDLDVWNKYLLGENLAERLAIEQRLGEGIGLDGGNSLYDRLASRGFSKEADVFDFINADEITHVRNGNCWLREVLMDQENLSGLDDRMRSKIRKAGLSHRLVEPLADSDRKLAGFTDEELKALHGLAASN